MKSPSSQPSQRATSHEPLHTEPKGPGAPCLSLPELRHGSGCTLRPKYNNNKDQKKSAAAATGLSLTATITTAATYRDTRSRPRTSSHMSGVNPIRMMVVGSVIPGSLFSHQSLLPPLRLLT
ncbi:Potassium-transporting ATPase potassium-binding subunit [Dissostichus eleginoides]|uniref:Potassium-transporting ATPase potassium-binding subunit n=1 Tax=Dissostichus eleginoides TaxID=100907 RepID=A0AAD9BPI2_DISEL|nr:Potassium-transporting ATPase potassium-binding subunit [Dissostichus eleginoides]